MKEPRSPQASLFDVPPRPQPARPQREVLSVSRLNNKVRQLLERQVPSVWVEGEVSNLSQPASGHLYFSLKDAGAQLRCVMFQKRRNRHFTPRDGMQVLARGRVTLYEARGDYQLSVEHLEESGEGALRRAFEELKTRLAAEGLFDEARKRPLPTLPRRIGVLTSRSGAALHDILQVLRRRFPAVPVRLYPIAVQGAAAAPGIVAALRLAARRADCDVLILARGGGSLEDLWPFNDETVARAIRSSPIPVVSAVGHEVDVTIADFAADRRAATPSVAAEIVVPDAADWVRAVKHRAQRLRAAMLRRLAAAARQRLALAVRLENQHPGTRLRQRMQRLDELGARLLAAQRLRLQRERRRLAHARSRLEGSSPGKRLDRFGEHLGHLRTRLASAIRSRLGSTRMHALNLTQRLQGIAPEATLARGYAIVFADGQPGVVRDASQLRPGQRIVARLARGQVHADVREVGE